MTKNNTSLEFKCGSGSIRKKLRSGARICPQSSILLHAPFPLPPKRDCTQKVGSRGPCLCLLEAEHCKGLSWSCSEMFNIAREPLTGLGGLAAARPCPSQPHLFSLPLFPGALWNALDRRVHHKGTIGLLGQLCLAEDWAMLDLHRNRPWAFFVLGQFRA